MGSKNLFELGLGIYCNDGNFPFSLPLARFSNVISHRVNCEYCKCGDVVFHNIMHVTVTMKTSPFLHSAPPLPAHRVYIDRCIMPKVRIVPIKQIENTTESLASRSLVEGIFTMIYLLIGLH